MSVNTDARYAPLFAPSSCGECGEPVRVTEVNWIKEAECTSDPDHDVDYIDPDVDDEKHWFELGLYHGLIERAIDEVMS